MPVFETEARIGRIISIDGKHDKVCILYPRFKVSLRHDDVMKLNLKTGELFALRIKNPASPYEGYEKDDQYPMLDMRIKITGFTKNEGIGWWNPTAYVNVHCVLETNPLEGETVITLREQHLKMLNLKKNNTFLITISDKYAKTN